MFQFKARVEVAEGFEEHTLLAEDKIVARSVARDLSYTDELAAVQITWEPQVGDGCHIAIGADRSPATVVRVTKNQVTVRRDKSRSGGRMFLIDPDGGEETFTRRKNGHWALVGAKAPFLAPGRCSYLDPHF